MSIQGELTIHLSSSDDQLHCQITSSRPKQAAQIFAGKSISQTLTTLPLLFSICAKAQTITAVRAIESATQTTANAAIESTREALITLENLREHCFRVAMGWAEYIQEAPDNECLAHISLGINQIMQSLEPKKVTAWPAAPVTLSNNHQMQWQSFASKLSLYLYEQPAREWLDSITQDKSMDNWSSQQSTQAARFIHWLNQQSWKHAGASSITRLPEIKDEELLTRLLSNPAFTAQPDWNDQCFELSWFSQRHGKQHQDNDLYTRLTARLTAIAEAMNKLNDFFIHGAILEAPKSTATGLTHSDAARGRLSHYVDIEGEQVKRLVILAPTEWNFHPQGIAADSLSHLMGDTPQELRQQAELMIHAIDPCVGYKLVLS